jgi:hypothetical protein
MQDADKLKKEIKEKERKIKNLPKKLQTFIKLKIDIRNETNNPPPRL